MRAPEYEAMIAPARLYPQLWRLLLGILMVVFFYISCLALFFVGILQTQGPMELGYWMLHITNMTAPVPTLIALSSLGVLVVGTMVAAAALHMRGPASLFGPWDETLRGFCTVMLVATPFYAAFTAVGFILDWPLDNLSWRDWLGWLPFALPLVLLQVTGEEVFFRGYLPQQLAARFKSRLIWMVLPAALFGIAHFNPAAGDLKWVIIFITFLIGLIAMDLTERTGSLGAAIGLHFVNNIFALLILSVNDSITGLARWVTPFSMGEMGPMKFALIIDIVFLLIVWRVVRWAVER